MKRRIGLLVILSFLLSTCSDTIIYQKSLNEFSESFLKANLEENETFYEGVLDTKTGKRKTFFNLGPGNDWRRLLDDKIKIKLEKAFEKEMIELEYL